VRLKLDENIGRSGIEFLRQRGHDVATIYEERLAGAADAVVFVTLRSQVEWEARTT
jgi:hypothetical protein